MPELPEVEIVRSGLEPVLRGMRFKHVEQRRPDLRFPFPENFACRLEGAKVTALERRAKYLLARLDSGEVLVMHLGMTGRFSVGAGAKGRVLGEYAYDPGCDPAHEHVRFEMSNRAVVTYSDPRRFGFMLLVPEHELAAHPLFRSLGVEPLESALDSAYLAHRAEGRRSDLKAFLLDQHNIAGIGNIYACEALHRARLSPRRRASVLALRGGKPSPRAEPLVQAVKTVLADALRAGGSTLRDFRHADGESGAFQETFRVYDREGAACPGPGCRGTIRRIVQAGRSTFYCPQCQR